MRNLTSLLERLSNTLNRDENLKQGVIGIVKQRTGIDLPASSVELKGGYVAIEATPAVKNEISLKEELILEDIRMRHSLNISRIFYK